MIIVLADVVPPVSTTPELPSSSPEDSSLDPPVGLEPEPVFVGVLPLLLLPVPDGDAAPTKGLESDAIEACERSNLNCLYALCCWMVAEADSEFMAEPVAQAEMKGEELRSEEARVHVVPVR
jgi:hypothetical protein